MLYGAVGTWLLMTEAHSPEARWSLGAPERSKMTFRRVGYLGYLLPRPLRTSQFSCMRPRRIRLLILAAGILALSALLNAKQLAVVTDTANPTTNISAADLQKIFNLHTHAWADGKPVIIVMRDPSAAEMQLLLHRVLNMSTDQARAFIQAHKGTIVVADSDDAVIRFVSSNRGAIGVIDLYSLTKGVNVLKIDSKLPVEQGYLLRGNEP